MSVWLIVALGGALLGVLSNWLRPKWLWSLVCLVVVVSWVRFMLPFELRDPDAFNNLVGGCVYFLWFGVWCVGLPFVVGRYLYRWLRPLFVGR